MSPSIEPVTIQTLGQSFFRLYMAKYPEVFQKWVLEQLGYEYTESYDGKLFPHISEVPKGYKGPKSEEEIQQDEDEPIDDLDENKLDEDEPIDDLDENELDEDEPIDDLDEEELDEDDEFEDLDEEELDEDDEFEDDDDDDDEFEDDDDDDFDYDEFDDGDEFDDDEFDDDDDDDEDDLSMNLNTLGAYQTEEDDELENDEEEEFEEEDDEFEEEEEEFDDDEEEEEEEDDDDDDDDDDEWPFNLKLKDLPEFIYFSNLKHAGKPKFKSTYLQFLLLQENDANTELNLLNDFTKFTRYSRQMNMAQMAVYVGDYPFHSPTKIDDFCHKFYFPLLDLTQIAVDTVAKHDDFHIQLLAIFNHHMPIADKVECIVAGMLRTYHEKGLEDAEYYFRLLELTETPKNLPALNQIFDRLAISPEYQHLQRNTLAEYPRTLDEVEQHIMQVMVNKAITFMYKTKKDALDAASTMNLKPVEFQMLLNHIKATNGVVKAVRTHLR
jgi:hypothetical protein